MLLCIIAHYSFFCLQGILQPDMWNVEPSSLWDWSTLREKIRKNGVRNSLLVAPMPTASTSQILGNNECFEPYTSNIYSRRVLRLKLVQFHRCCLLLLELPWDFILTSVFLWWPVVNLWWWTNICWVIWQTWAYGLQSWKIKSYIIMVPFKRLKGSLKNSRAFTGKSF